MTGRVLLQARQLGRLGFAHPARRQRRPAGDGRRRRASAPRTSTCWRHDIDLGDHVGVTGEVITTQRGELSVRADVAAADQQVAAAAARQAQGPDRPRGPGPRPLRRPDRPARGPRHRLHRARRSCAASATRCTRRGFTEVETPILQLIHGGANARPFETHINAYDMDLYLRIATELHLKRLLVGGMEKVFEIGRQFRNEGADFKHNPEFTSLEVYETYGDYDTMRVLTQELIQEAAIAVYGAPVARRPDADGKIIEYDLSGDWPVKTICQAVSEKLGEEVTADTPVEVLLRARRRRSGSSSTPTPSWGFVLEEIYDELCEGTTTTPVFYTDFPKENAPLTRQHRDDPRLAEKWDLVIFARRAGHRLLRADRPGGPARAARRPVAARRRRRPGGDAGRRGLPRRPSSTACRRPAAWAWASTGW